MRGKCAGVTIPSNYRCVRSFTNCPRWRCSASFKAAYRAAKKQLPSQGSYCCASGHNKAKLDHSMTWINRCIDRVLPVTAEVGITYSAFRRMGVNVPINLCSEGDIWIRFAGAWRPATPLLYSYWWAISVSSKLRLSMFDQ